MNIQKLREELEADEGIKYVTYKCSADKLTFGVGHMVLESDPEYNQPVGTAVSADRVTECFNRDIESVIEDCQRLYSQFDSLPEDCKLIIANMMFNLGLPTLSKFKDMKAAIDAEQWSAAADAMLDSKWAKQLPNRSGRLITRMRSV
tara:strand:- start:29 stop:469 length:441 start_codon:yes stop_codon:yes gene_type:complete